MPLVSYVLIIVGLFYLIRSYASLKSTPKKITFLRKILSPKQYLFYQRLTGIIVILLSVLLATVLKK